VPLVVADLEHRWSEQACRDALVLNVREGGRVVPVHALVATGVNADGHREILGIPRTS
jgi:transposase-like protein